MTKTGTLTKDDLPIGTKVRFLTPSGIMRTPIPRGTVGEIIRHSADSRNQYFTAKYRWLTDEGYIHHEYRHGFAKEGISWEQNKEDRKEGMGKIKLGDIVESRQELDSGAGYYIPSGTRGVVREFKQGGTYVFVVDYEWVDRGRNLRASYTHNTDFEGDTYRLVGHSASIAHSMTIESEKEINLYVAQSTETIDGWVPQVKYGDVIVWQGDPVSNADKDGEALSNAQQSTNAIGAASDKIKEVVKKQFA